MTNLDQKQDARISRAGAACLNSCDAEFMPFATIEKYLGTIKADPEWSQSEIIELQTRLIREILNRQLLQGGVGEAEREE